MPWVESYLSELQNHTRLRIPAIATAFGCSEDKLTQLGEIVGNIPDEMSFVVFGSLGRKEYNSGSDLDWALIIDGKADAAQRSLEREKRIAIEKSGIFRKPNPAGAFGALTFGHELIHCIGGTQDTNANLTRRLLLLLESTEVTHRMDVTPRERVMRGVLQRYFEEESHFPEKDFFPRFFLNDVVRYWRTIAVDYAAKNSERGAEEWALRNAKLRFSRKLLYVAGLLLTYETTLFPSSDLVPEIDHQPSLFDTKNPELSSTEHCFHALRLTPLELLARACTKLDLPKNDVIAIFESYDEFLAILDYPERKSELASLSFEESKRNKLFQRVREIGNQFQGAVDRLFLAPETLLGRLTLEYAIF